MISKMEKQGLKAVNRSLTGILAAAIVMSQLSGTGLVVRAAELETPEMEETVEDKVEIEKTEEIIEELSTTKEKEESITDEMTEEESVENNTEIETETDMQEEMTEEASIQEMISEEVVDEIATDESVLFAGVYLQFDSMGGNCDVSMIELTPDNMNFVMPIPQKAGYRFIGWFIDETCTMLYDEGDIVWQAGNSYVLYAGYEPLAIEEIELAERTLSQTIHGVTITVEGNMPQEAILEVKAEELSQEDQKSIAAESDVINSHEDFGLEENKCYSYDISIYYQDVKYEPYLFDESMEVTFSFADTQELQNADCMEVFHIDDNEFVEKIEITDVNESEVSFEADAFSTYILITKVEYTGNKNWTYAFTGDVQTFVAPVSGQYVFECYGAGIESSKGSFSKGTLELEKNEMVYIYVGGQNHTFNGGGQGGSVHHIASNSGGTFNQNVESDHGCGATDVRLGSELESRLIVAGGGAGNGHQGGVYYSYNGFHVSDGPGYSEVLAKNQVQSNDILGQGDNYTTNVNSGVWGTGDSYPDRGTYNIRTVTGGGGGGYFGGQSGYAGTSKVISFLEYNGKEYHTSDYEIENLVYTGNGKCQVSLYSLQADVITYYNYNMTKLGESAGLAGSYVNFPQMTDEVIRPGDSKYDYTFLGWDDMATEVIEYYTDAQTVEVAMNGDRNYIAAYECIGKSYAVILDSANAQKPGTKGIMATYHAALPNIEIPEKDGSIFEGYFTGQNGTGTKVYSADGVAVGISEIEEEMTLYAHWVQPITEIISPQDREVLAGYAGVVFSTEVELYQSTGYSLNYQWYMSHDEQIAHGIPIEEADTRKLNVPQGFQPGKYYFYCLITATNVVNGQAVIGYTIPAAMIVEKGIMGMEHVEVEKPYFIYDATSKALKVAINSSNPYTVYYSEEPLTAENYQIKGKIEPFGYTDAGEYTNYIYVTGTDFADFSGSIHMKIDKANPDVYLTGKNTTYNGQIQNISAAKVYGVHDEEMEMLVAYVYFVDEACTKKTDASCGALTEGGAPSAVGTYYVHAVTQETTNYHDVATKTPAMFNILGTHAKYSISGYHGKYDGKAHGLQIINEDAQNTTIYFSDSMELTKDNYQIAGTIEPYEYTNIGRYPVYYMVVTKIIGGIEWYENGMAEVIIEEVKQNVGGNDSENSNGNHGNDADHGSTGNHGGNGGTSEGTGSVIKPGTTQTHKHNYELISFVEPTATKEGKAIYRCIECKHELVVSYPASGNTEGDTITKEEGEKEIDKAPEDEKNSNKEKENSREENKEKEPVKLTNKELEQNIMDNMEEELRKALTEAELLRMAESLKNLTEAELRDLYEKGFLNLSEEEFERLISMICTQVIIDEERVGLSDEFPTGEKEESVNKQMPNYVGVLWAFLLGAVIMFLLRELMQKNRKEDNEQKKMMKTGSFTRRLK